MRHTHSHNQIKMREILGAVHTNYFSKINVIEPENLKTQLQKPAFSVTSYKNEEPTKLQTLLPISAPDP